METLPSTATDVIKAENTQFRAENARLRAEVQQLHERIEDLEANMQFQLNVQLLLS